MKKLIIALRLTVLLLVVLPVSAQMDMNTAYVNKAASAQELRTNLRTLWEDHAMYTRNVILNIIDGLPGTDEAVARLLKNQDDLGDAIKPVYGEAAGKKLTELLKVHIVIAADLLKAAKANNQQDFATANTKWHRNADDISVFLNTANPSQWKLEDMKKMMYEHLDLTTKEAVARLKKDYKADIDAFDKTRAELLEMSDMLANGIVKQFPDKFNR